MLFMHALARLGRIRWHRGLRLWAPSEDGDPYTRRGILRWGLFIFLIGFCLVRDAYTQRTGGGIVTVPLFAGKVEGRVLIEGQDIHQPPVAAEHVKVQLENEEGGEVLHEAVTDKEGNFSLLVKEPGIFLLRVGRLKIRIQVEPVNEDVAPKKVLFVIPRLMAR